VLSIRSFALLVAGFALGLGADSSAQSRKLNPPLVREVLAAGGVLDAQIGSDGAWVAYSAMAAGKFGPARLYGVPIQGGSEPHLLAEVLSRFAPFSLVPDGRTVVYKEASGASPLFRVPVDGSTAPKRLGPHAEVESFLTSPDGVWIVYAARTGAGGSGLFAFPLDGSRAPLLLDADSSALAISPDGRVVVYAKSTTIWSAPLDGGSAPVRLSASPEPSALAISPDSRWVVYRADPRRNVFELFSVLLDGSAPALKLNGPLPGLGDVDGFSISSDSRHVVYAADQALNDMVQLYAAPIDGSAPAVVRNGPLVPGGDVASFQLVPASASIVYRSDEEVDESHRLYFVGIEGDAAPRRIGGARVLEVGASFQVTADGERVVFVGEELGHSEALYSAALGRNLDALLLAEELHDPLVQLGPRGGVVLFRHRQDQDLVVCSVPSDGSAPPTVLPPLGASIQFSPDEKHLLFRSGAANDAYELFSLPLDAGADPVRLSDPVTLVLGETYGDVSSFRFGPLGELVLAVEGSTLDSPILPDEAYRLELGLLPAPRRLFPWRPGEPRDFFRYVFSPDGARLVFTAGDDPGESEDLYALALDGAAEPVLLSDPSNAYFAIGRFEVTPDGRTVVYLQEDDDEVELYAVPIDRSAEPVELNGPLADGGNVHDFRLAPDGARLVYLADERIPGTREIFSLSLAEGGAALPLIEPPPAAGRGVSSLELAPDGARVVFLADLEADDVFELHSAPADASAAPRKLSPQPVAGGNVTRFELAPDGGRVVFLGDLETDGVPGLFGVPADGSAPALRLNGDLAGTGSLWTLPYGVSFRITSAGRVVYCVDQSSPGVVELYGAPLDGSAPSVKLSGALVAGGGVEEFLVSDDGRRVVYLADQRADEVCELFAVPAEGGAPPMRLSAALPPDGDVRPGFQISPDGRWVAYVADQLKDERFEFFAVPADGSGVPRRLNDPLVEGGDVLAFPSALQFSPDSRRVLFLADGDENDVFELYESVLPRSAIRAPGRPFLR
jgi:Tol biopolymer transport system component